MECEAGSLRDVAQALDREEMVAVQSIRLREESVAGVIESDIVLVEVARGDDTDRAALRNAAAIAQGASMLAVETHGCEMDVRAAVAAGAAGVISAELADEPARLLGAMMVVVGGGLVSAGARAGQVAERLRRVDAGGSDDRPPLTERELDVLRLVAEGCSNREIAERLSIAEQSAKNHISNVLRKLHAPNRTAAVAIARRGGLID